MKRAEAILEKAKGRELRGPEEVYARETVLMAKYPDKVELQLQAMRVGDLAIVAIPCEVFTEIGLAIKRESPFKTTCVVSLANGYNGYLPTPEQHALGRLRDVAGAVELPRGEVVGRDREGARRNAERTGGEIAEPAGREAIG